MLLERLGLHQCQGKYGQPAWTTGRIPFEGVSVLVPPIAKHPCTCRHRWNSNPSKGPFVNRMAMHLGHFTVISLAENVTTLNSVLPVCQGGHNAQCLKSITILDGVRWPRNHTERYSRERHGGAKQPRDLRAQKSFEQGRDGGCVFFGSLASPVKGGIESRRMHQMHQVKLGANKGGRL